MRATESPVAFVASRMRSSRLQGTATDCSNIYVATARWRWPDKTAENWAAAAGRKPRMAAYWLKGDVSAEGKLAILKLFD